MLNKQWLLLLSFLFLVPTMGKAQLVFKEGNKLWQNHSPAEYERDLAASVVRFPDRFQVSKNNGVDLGPVAIRLGGFRGGVHPYFDYWVRVHPLPNIHLDNQVLVKILINHVWDFKQNDLYNRKKQSYQSIQNIAGDEALTFISKLHLNPGSDVGEIQEISGEVIFSLPLKLTWLTFESADLKKEKGLPSIASKVRLSNLRFNGESTWVEIRYQGKEGAYLTTLGYDKTGTQLRKKGFAKNSVSGGWLYVYAFAGEVEKIQTLLSIHAIKRKYPFTIKP